MKYNYRTLYYYVVAGVVFLASAAATKPDLGGSLKALNLSTYAPGTKAPDFSGDAANADKISLATLRGRVVIINFWATWCLECRPEMPVFERLHREWAAQGLAVIGINAREGRTTVRDYATELNLTFPLVLDPKGEIMAAYGVIGLPTTFLIGRDGQPVALAIGPREWASAPSRRLIQALLAEPGARKGKQ